MLINACAPNEIAQVQESPALFCTLIVLLLGGWLAMGSASIPVAERLNLSNFYFVRAQLATIILGLGLMWLLSFVPFKIYQRYSWLLLIICILGLIVIHIPGLGLEVNGSVRWLNLLGFKFQISELTKFAMLLYLASYLSVQRETLLPLLIVILIISTLLLLQPDFGSTVVVAIFSLGLLFLIGVELKYFIYLSVVTIASASILIISAKYRLVRVLTFLDPWSDQFNSGYQLTQSLIAFGRGGVWGLGLGNSIQKMHYLPEAHTDFVLAIIGEELGLIGCLIFLALFSLLILQIARVGLHALHNRQDCAGLYGCGLAIWLGAQALIHTGVNIGLLPTKGLTLPLVSYGRTSLLVFLIALGLVFSIIRESKNLCETKY